MSKTNMSKFVVSTFFLFLFTAFISAPTVLNAIDDTIDISVFYSLSEEEEKGNETIKNFEIITSDLKQADLLISLKSQMSTIGYCYKKYPKPHLNLISPPPEQSI